MPFFKKLRTNSKKSFKPQLQFNKTSNAFLFPLASKNKKSVRKNDAGAKVFKK